MRRRSTIARPPATAQGITGLFDMLLQLLNVIAALYRVFVSLFGGAS